MRRKDHPSFPSAITCCFFSSLKTLPMPREPTRASLGVNVPGSAMAGFQVILYGRFWVTAEGLENDFIHWKLSTDTELQRLRLRFCGYAGPEGTHATRYATSGLKCGTRGKCGTRTDT